MINGVMSIVAAVLFAVVALKENMDVIWLAIAGIYLVWGILNLIIYWVKINRKQKAAQQALKKAEEKAAKAAVPATEPKKAGMPELKPAETANNPGGTNG